MSTLRLRANDCLTDFDAVAGVAGCGDGSPSEEKLILKAPADGFYGDLGLRFELCDGDAFEGGPALRIIVPVPQRIDALDDEPVAACFMQKNGYKRQVFGMSDSLVVARERRPGRRKRLKQGAPGASSEAEGCVLYKGFEGGRVYSTEPWLVSTTGSAFGGHTGMAFGGANPGLSGPGS